MASLVSSCAIVLKLPQVSLLEKGTPDVQTRRVLRLILLSAPETMGTRGKMEGE